MVSSWASASGRSWDPGGGNPPAGGPGTWDLSSPLWWDGSALVPWNDADDDTAIFPSTGGLITVNSSVSAGGLEFDAGGYQLSSGAGGSLTLAGGTPTVSVVHAADSDTLALPITTTLLIKTGAGTLVLNTAASPSMLSHVTGDIAAIEGTLAFDPGFAQALVLNNPLRGSGQFAFTGGGTLTLAGSGDFSGQFLDNGLSLRLNSNAALGNASLVVFGTSARYLATDGNVTIASAFRFDGSPTISLGTSVPFTQQLTLSGNIGGTGNLTLNGLGGNGTLHLSGTNAAWSGKLLVLGGTADVPVSSMPTGNVGVGPATNTDSATLLSRGSLTLPLGTGPGQIQFLEPQPSVGTIPHGSYLGAQGGPLDVNFGGNAVPTTLSFGNTPGFAPLGAFRLGGGNDAVTVHNPLDLGTAGNGADRIVEVKSSTAVLVGAITGQAQWNLVKQGPGTLVLSGSNTYSGDTIPEGGVLEIGSSAALSPNTTVRFRNLGATFRVADGVTAHVGEISYPAPDVFYGDTTPRLVTTVGTGTLALDGWINFPQWNAGQAGILNLSGNIDLGSTNHVFQIGGDFHNQVNSLVSNAVFRGAGMISAGGRGVLDLSGNSTFSGGLYSANVLWIRNSSTGAPGNVTSGPVGTGTLHLVDGYLYGDPSSNHGVPPNIGNPVSLGGGNIGLSDIELSGPISGGNISVPVVDSTGVTLSGPISGIVFYAFGPGLVTLSGDNSNITEALSVGGGEVHAISPHALGAPTAETDIGPGGMLEITGTMGSRWLNMSGTAAAPAILRPVLFSSATWDAPINLLGTGELIGDGVSPLTVTGNIIDLTGDHTGELDTLGAVTIARVNANTLHVNGALTLQKTGPGASRINNLVFGNQSKLDLTDQTLDVAYDTASPAAALRAFVQSGYDGGAWDGIGITSSRADATHFAVGYGDSADGVVTAVAANTVRVKFTRYGDANLSGTVDFSDLLILAQHYGQTSATWDQGDFNYDGVVGFDDLLLLAQNYGGTLSPAQLASLGPGIRTDVVRAFDAVPEPAFAVLLAAALLLPRGVRQWKWASYHV